MFWGPKVIERVDSKYSGELEVRQNFGHKYIATGKLTQSGGLVKEVWEKTIRSYPKMGNSWLILGLGGGTVAKLIGDLKQPSIMVGVEIDPEMIRLGKKYLELGKIPNLTIKLADANRYVGSNRREFDTTLIDMYVGDNPPEFIYQWDFLKKVAKFSRRLLINHLYYEESKKQKAKELIERLGRFYREIKLSKVLTNLIISCENRI